jgi:hypothetical protein
LNQIAFGPLMGTMLGTSEFVLAQDFNGDGKLDVAIDQEGNGGGVRVLLGNGNGMFSLKPLLAGGGNRATGIAAADFDRNGHLDIAFLSPNATGGPILSIFLGNGDGSFNLKTTVPVGSGAYGLATAEISGDANADLVVTNSSDSTYSVLLGAGDGTFTAKPAVATGANPGSVVLEDVNGDGVRDLLIVNQNDATTSVSLGKGDGTFQLKTTLQVGLLPTDLAVANLDGDQNPDVVVSSVDDHSIWVFKGAGDGTFLKKGTLPLSDANGQGYGVTLVDLNHDGFVDLAVSENIPTMNSAVDLFINDGHGSFQRKVSLSVGKEPRRLIAADLTGDQRPDLILVLADLSTSMPNELDVFLNTSP